MSDIITVEGFPIGCSERGLNALAMLADFYAETGRPHTAEAMREYHFFVVGSPQPAFVMETHAIWIRSVIDTWPNCRAGGWSSLLGLEELLRDALTADAALQEVGA